MANEKRLIYFDDAIERIVNFPSKVAHDNFYGKKQFTPIQMLNALADRQHEIIDQLEKVRTVDAVEVVHGRWVVGGACNHVPHRIKNPEKWVVYKCSACGYSNGRKQSNYCPNCGAAMDGDGDE